jgi:hypothetical protein
MASTIARSIWGAIRGVSSPSRDDVHFHIDSHGRPYVCDFHRCDSPSLTAREATMDQSGPGRRAR